MLYMIFLCVELYMPVMSIPIDVCYLSNVTKNNTPHLNASFCSPDLTTYQGFNHDFPGET